MLGFGTARVELVEADAQGRMIPSELERVLGTRSHDPSAQPASPARDTAEKERRLVADVRGVVTRAAVSRAGQ